MFECVVHLVKYYNKQFNFSFLKLFDIFIYCYYVINVIINK